MADRRHDHVAGYEPYELRVRPVVVFAVVLTIVTVVVLGLMQYAHGALEREVRSGEAPRHPLAAPSEIEPSPRLETTSGEDLEKLRAREYAVLSTYGWVDRPSGIVRIPIERAMEFVAKEGLPVRGR